MISWMFVWILFTLEDYFLYFLISRIIIIKKRKKKKKTTSINWWIGLKNFDITKNLTLSNNYNSSCLFFAISSSREKIGTNGEPHYDS